MLVQLAVYIQCVLADVKFGSMHMHMVSKFACIIIRYNIHVLYSTK